MSYALRLVEDDVREPDAEELDAMRAGEWEFRIDHDLVSDDAWHAYVDACGEWWAQMDEGAPPEAVLAEKRHAEWWAARLERESELRAMPYVEYLHTPEWQKRRSAALARAEGRCQLCNIGSHLDVHHRTYERRGTERDDDLIVLCKRCHGLFHEHRRLARWGSTRPLPHS